jgi:glycine/D-amino acid oxidase-like deaminating enzyme
MRCAQSGANVTLLEKTGPAAGATSKSFAWINAFMDDPYYMKMRLDATRRWQLLDKPLGMGIIWGGYLGFTDRIGDRGRMAIQSKHLAELGHPTRSLDIEMLKQMSPAIDPGALVEATWSDLGGHVDPVHATRRFLAAATAAGARILYPYPVSAIEPAGHQVTVVTPRGRLEFDRVVIAAGVDAPGLLAPLGYTLPLLHRPGALVHSKPLPIMTRFVYDGPGEMEWKQAADGSVIGQEAPNPPPIPVHAAIRDHVMEFPPGIAAMHGARILSKLAVYMPGVARAEVDFVTLGFRPMPVDGFPVVGPVPGVPGVSLCVTHSGVTLAALFGDYMAQEVVTGLEEPMLAPYRPTRSMTAPPSA